MDGCRDNHAGHQACGDAPSQASRYPCSSTDPQYQGPASNASPASVRAALVGGLQARLVVRPLLILVGARLVGLMLALVRRLYLITSEAEQGTDRLDRCHTAVRVA